MDSSNPVVSVDRKTMGDISYRERVFDWEFPSASAGGIGEDKNITMNNIHQRIFIII